MSKKKRKKHNYPMRWSLKTFLKKMELKKNRYSAGESGLCELCQHRADSIKRVQESPARGGGGLICDPAPRAECKDHAGYGRSGIKTFCRDFKPMEGGI